MLGHYEKHEGILVIEQFENYLKESREGNDRITCGNRCARDVSPPSKYFGIWKEWGRRKTVLLGRTIGFLFLTVRMKDFSAKRMGSKAKQVEYSDIQRF